MVVDFEYIKRGPIVDRWFVFRGFWRDVLNRCNDDNIAASITVDEVMHIFPPPLGMNRSVRG
jgi:hypothetical protein